MKNLSRFNKERVLRQAGEEVPPYPTLVQFQAEGSDLADRRFLSACSAWEDTLDAAYLAWVQTLPAFKAGADLPEFVGRCEQYGLTAGLAALNARVQHRWTALYQLDDGKLRNIELIDKAGEIRPSFLAEVPLGDSFCQFVMRDGVFGTSDSAQDDRLNGHPYKGVMVAYHGVPVLNGVGDLFGSLCHFDTQERAISDDELAVLADAAKLVSPYLMFKRGA